MDDGRWTGTGTRMDRDYVAPFRANPNIADPSDPTDQSEKTIDQITNSRAIPSVKAATPIKIFVLLSLDFLFFVQDFQKPDSQVTGFEVLSHF
jgi:hypothetical protein